MLLSGAYDPLVPYFSQMKVNQFVLEYATERAGSLDVLAGLPEDKEIGLGVVDLRTPEIEQAATIQERIRTLLRYRLPGQIFLNPDCGFGTFADRPVNTTEIAARKLGAIRQAADALRVEMAERT